MLTGVGDSGFSISSVKMILIVKATQILLYTGLSNHNSMYYTRTDFLTDLILIMKDVIEGDTTDPSIETCFTEMLKDLEEGLFE